MASKGVIIAILIALSTLGDKGTSSTPDPAIGDIKLVPSIKDGKIQYYEVLIYYSDGINKPHFGGVCADESYDEEAQVICQQMGYEYTSHLQNRPSNTPVWFTHIECNDKSTSHILRCNTTVADGNGSNVCGKDNNRLLVSCDFKTPLTHYDGQVLLCPEDSNSTNKSSTSYGLVAIYYEDNGVSKGINQKGNKPMGGYEADAICQSMGFTGAYPGSAVTRNVDNLTFSECFSNTFQHGAWVTTDSIKCDGPQKCLGCCMKYPNRGRCDDCIESHNIVIRCVFDPTQKDKGEGLLTGCKLDSGKKVKLCEVDNSQKIIRDLKISLGFIATLLVLLGPCGCCCLGYLYKKHVHQYCIKCVHKSPKICCKDYMPIDENVDHNREQINQPQPT